MVNIFADQARETLLDRVRSLCRRGKFDEAEALLRDAPAEYAEHLDHALCLAETAQLRCSFDDALERTLAIVQRFPTELYGHAASVLLLTAANRIEQASAMLLTARERFGDAPELSTPAIHLHVARQDWHEAATALARFAEAHPDAAATADLRAVIDAGLARDLGGQAQAAEAQGAFAEAVALWRRHAERFGSSRDNALALLRCHHALGDAEGADRVLRQAALDHPGDPEIEAHLALAAGAAGDWPRAADRWREILRQHPQHTGFGGMAATALARSGAVQEAEAVLDGLIQRDPQSLDLRSAHAVVAQFGGNWEAAVQRWDVLCALAPGNQTLRNLRGEAVWHRKLAGAQQEPEPDRAVTGAEPDLPEIVTHFESVGDNCEFGLLQRHFGAEPTTLFRFSALQPENLIALLDLGMEPLGDPAHTSVIEEGCEYVVRDDRGYYWMHSFLRIGQVDPARYLKQQNARITLLKRKFLSDLRTGGKIYVCKQSATRIPDETLRAVSASLAAYGDNMLLGIRLADAEHPGGTVDRLERNILVGYVATLFGGLGGVTDHASWERVVRIVHKARMARD